MRDFAKLSVLMNKLSGLGWLPTQPAQHIDFVNKLESNNIPIKEFDYCAASDEIDRVTYDRCVKALIADGLIRDESEYHEYMLKFLSGLKLTKNSDPKLDNTL